MATTRCLRCGYPVSEGSGCLCGTPTVRQHTPTPWNPIPAATGQAELKPSIPQAEKDQLNHEYLKIKSFWDDYQTKPGTIRELADTYYSLLELSNKNLQYASRPEILEELTAQIQHEYWRRYPYARTRPKNNQR